MRLRREHCIYSSLLLLTSCASAPKFNEDLIRPWKTELENESPSHQPFIAHHKSATYELLYLAAHHSTDPKSDTSKLVKKLFHDFKFDFLIIEPIQNREGESPEWFLKEAKRGVTDSVIIGGESSLSVLGAYENRIPFAGGEADHKEIYRQLKRDGFDDQDVLGFYLVRQIPQWVREKENQKDVIQRKGPALISYYCKIFGINKLDCPKLKQLENWYEIKAGEKLDASVDTEEVAPIHGSPLFTHRISSAVGAIRDRFTLHLIQDYLAKHRRVAVVYGGSHYLTLRKSIEAALGAPTEVILPSTK